ncbi:MAG: HTTM domain-containing protein [Candidatus Caenarcaniphilales bacterium]|nr:HTTM domain-containing protein [Candidatus Caenarcaniphilales bacterium]
MNLESCIRFTEIFLAIAFMQQSIEHFSSIKQERRLFVTKFIYSTALLVAALISATTLSKWILLILFINRLFILKYFQGPYNGGSDSMSILILSVLCMSRFSTELEWQVYAFGYLALQLLMSYFIAGSVKIMNPDWRNGKALQDLFEFSAYPSSESLRKLSSQATLLLILSWAVILFELLFPLALIHQTSLVIALLLAFCFHLGMSFIFGFNRFVWTWLAAYPAILWFHQHYSSVLGMIWH